MRIVNRETFLSMPEGTIYAKWGDGERTCKNEEAHFYSEVAVKGRSLGNDWIEQPLFAWPENSHNDTECSIEWDAALAGGETSDMCIGDAGSRDALFDKKQLFAVFNKTEAERLRGLIDWAIGSAYA